MSSILWGEIFASSSQACANVLTSSDRSLFITSLHFFGASDWLYSSILTLSSMASHPTYLLRDSATVSELYAAVGTITQGPFWLMKFARTIFRMDRISTGETLLSTSTSRKEPLGIEPPSIWSMPLLPREKAPAGLGTGSNGFGLALIPGCRNPFGSIVNRALSRENIPRFVGTLKPRSLFIAMVRTLLPSSSD